MNLKKILENIIFYFKSTNEHGVHSPFVFDFLTKCLYRKQNSEVNFLKEKKIRKKTTQAIFRILNYFKPKTLCFVGDELVNQNAFFENTQILKEENLDPESKIDAFFINQSIDLKEFDTMITHVHNDSFLLMMPTSRTLWQTIKNHEKVTVTIDCYQFMLVFFRKEQPKQNFKIRL